MGPLSTLNGKHRESRHETEGTTGNRPRTGRASATIIPKGGNKISKMAQKIYATPMVVANENAFMFQKSVMTTHLPKDS
jgi:hypothetical protein